MFKKVALVAIGAVVGAYIAYYRIYKRVARIAQRCGINISETNKSENTTDKKTES